MSISSETASVEYAGNNSASTPYSVTFRFDASSWLEVSTVASDGTVTVLDLGAGDFTVGGDGSTATGTITTATAVPATSTVRIRRLTPRTQTQDLAFNTDLPAATTEATLDKAVMGLQDTERRRGELEERALRFPDGESLSALAAAASRGGRVIYFNASTGAIELKTPNEILALSDGAPDGVGLPDGGSAGQQLVSDGAGGGEWETPTAYLDTDLGNADSDLTYLEKETIAEKFGFHPSSRKTNLEHLWRIPKRLAARADSSGGVKVRHNFRVVSIGDSYTIDYHDFFANLWGYGGEGHPITDSTNPMMTGGTNVQDEFASCVSGCYRTLTGAQELLIEPVFSSFEIYVAYIAENGGGEFKLQKDAGKASSFSDATETWSILSGSDSGSVSTSTIDTDNSTTEKACVAKITLAELENNNYKILPTSGTVKIIDVWVSASNPIAIGENINQGAISLHWGRSGSSVSDRNTASQEVFTRTLGVYDPDFIIIRDDDAYQDNESDANEYLTKITTACPEATIIFISSNQTSAATDYYDDSDNRFGSDKWKRDWCERNKHVFIDLRQMLPDFVNDSSINDVNIDGVHPDASVVEFALSQLFGRLSFFLGHEPEDNAKNALRALPGKWNALRTFDQTAVVPSGLDNKLFLIAKPGSSQFIYFLNGESRFATGTSSFDLCAGIGATPDKANGTERGDLFLRAGGRNVGLVTFEGLLVGQYVSASATPRGIVSVAPATIRSALTLVALTSQTGNLQENRTGASTSNGTDTGSLVSGFDRYALPFVEPVTVSALPSSSVADGTRAFVSDSNVAAAGNFGAIVAGSGANIVPVYYDGTNWRIG